MNKIVVRYRDGKMLKGSTQNFIPGEASFHLMVADAGGKQRSVEVALSQLKAIFFVAEFGGKPEYEEIKAFDPSHPLQGRKVCITFTDGEVMVGTTMDYDPGSLGFFLFPADPKSNNKRIYVINASVRELKTAGSPALQRA
ncbi:MAG: hypothetical protein K8S99_14675 [Planctomycetes bacterium]|nr:hypothetical protein [Planctomycetota bacterium]